MYDDKALVPALLTVATEQAKSEGITEDEAIIERANEIFQDAILEEPLTEIGQSVRKYAIERLADNADGTPSPYSTKPTFDYEVYRDQRVAPTVAAILGIFAAQGEKIFTGAKSTPEADAVTEKSYEESSMQIFSVLNENKIGTAEFTYIFECLKAIITTMDTYIMQQVVGHRGEMMSRLFGAKNPGTGKFDAKYATYSDLLAALEKARQVTGNKPEDYFTVEKTPEE